MGLLSRRAGPAQEARGARALHLALTKRPRRDGLATEGYVLERHSTLYMSINSGALHSGARAA